MDSCTNKLVRTTPLCTPFIHYLITFSNLILYPRLLYHLSLFFFIPPILCHSILVGILVITLTGLTFLFLKSDPYSLICPVLKAFVHLLQ